MSFTHFSFHPHIQSAVKKCGFTVPTPIQNEAIPHVLAGQDILGLAQTGTGKTAAFVLPLVNHLLTEKTRHVRTLILAPTRELAEQIHTFAEEITDGTSLRSMAVYGGVSKQGQVRKIRGGVDIIVACPGRLLDILGDGVLKLDRIEHLVLDEADHMFDQGFLPDVRRILKYLPKKRQSLVFSATMPGEIRKLAEEILHRPLTVQIDRIKPADTVKHTLYSVSQSGKKNLLVQLLGKDAMATTLVFTKTKHKAKSLAGALLKAGFRATSLQGNLSQNKRQQALDGFRAGKFNILVATDIAARGIDVSAISHVINFDAPDTADAYIHRTGRTGRALKTGEAATFVTEGDGRIIHAVEKILKQKMHRGDAGVSEFTADTEKVSAIREPRDRGPKRPFPAGKRKKSTRAATAQGRGGKTASVFGLAAAAK